jgi:hypothetical protein
MPTMLTSVPSIVTHKCCDIYTQCQVTALYTDKGSTVVARKQLYRHVSPETREHAIMENMFSV